MLICTLIIRNWNMRKYVVIIDLSLERQGSHDPGPGEKKM